MHNSNRQNGNIAVFITILVTTVLVLAGVFIAKNKVNEVNTDNKLQNEKPEAKVTNGPANNLNEKPQASITNTPTINDTRMECKSTNLNLQIKLPNDKWKCKIENFGKDQKGADGAIYANNGFFKVNISNQGRGAFCDPPDINPSSPRYSPDNTCKISAFYEKNGIELKYYRDNDGLHEIFGTQGGPTISITYTNMLKSELIESEKNEIFKLLDSIKAVN